MTSEGCFGLNSAFNRYVLSLRTLSIGYIAQINEFSEIMLLCGSDYFCIASGLSIFVSIPLMAGVTIAYTALVTISI